jgi:ankyrin repeat protein
MSYDLYLACEINDIESVRQLIQYPLVDPNEYDHDVHFSPLRAAVVNNNHQIVELLLTRPDLNPNILDSQKTTPLSHAFCNNYQKIVKLLLNDSRTLTDIPDVNGHKIIYWGIYFNALESIQLLLALRPDLKIEESDIPETPYKNLDDGKNLVKSYLVDPKGVRFKLQVQLGYTSRFIGELFAIIVYFTDGYLKTENSDDSRERFFLISKQLPLDLQMVLSNRVFGSSKDVVLSRDSEAGFRSAC